jgi:hypothetical protein
MSRVMPHCDCGRQYVAVTRRTTTGRGPQNLVMAMAGSKYSTTHGNAVPRRVNLSDLETTSHPTTTGQCGSIEVLKSPSKQQRDAVRCCVYLGQNDIQLLLFRFGVKKASRAKKAKKERHQPFY